MSSTSIEFYRLDPLTGSNNFLSFVETLNQLSSVEEHQPFSILYLDMNHLQMLNETRGHSYGDSAIRWLGIVLQEESGTATYRVGGDEFAVILTAEKQSENEEMLNRIFDRLNREGEQLGIPSPAARIALIHYGKNGQFSFNDVMFQLGETMLDLKTREGRTSKIFEAQDLIKSTTKVHEHSHDDINHSWEVLRSIANQAINRVLVMGHALDAAQKNALLDSTSGLPNMRAALLKLENAISSKQPFAILLMDGDELTRYNNISYAAGDDMIQKISSVLTEKLRPGDFVARWRAGDEFIAILPNTTTGGAMTVGERFRSAIQEASQLWQFPTSISIGVAMCPKHGTDINTLVDNAEHAMKKAKDLGKNRVIFAE